MEKNYKEIADRLISAIEKSRFEEYAESRGNVKKMLWHGFLSGMARGVGMAVGFAVLGALIVLLLGRLLGLETPVVP